MGDLPPDLHFTLEQMRLCASGIDEAPPYQAMGKVIRRLLPLGTHFVWAHQFERNGKPGPWVLLVEQCEVWERGQQVADAKHIYDSRKFDQMTHQQLCQWFLAEIGDA